MPKVEGKVLKTKTSNGRFQALILLNGKLPKQGERVSVRWGAIRSLPQNALYWKFIDWLIKDAGLKDMGHFDSIAFHDNLKARFKVESTTQMDKVEFGEYFDKVDELARDFFEIDTKPFWDVWGNEVDSDIELRT